MVSNDRRPPIGDRLPIKLVLPRQGTERKVKPGGGKKEPFRPVTANYRQSLLNQLTAVGSALTPALRRMPAAPARVRLISKAVAKSHRPETLFSRATCPIVGAGRLGELYIKATPDGLERLERFVRENDSDTAIRELSCVEAVEPITPADRRQRQEPIQVLERSPRGKEGFLTRVRLFDLGRDPKLERAEQQQLVADFLAECERLTIRVSRGAYSPLSFTYEVECRRADDVDALSRVVGVRSIRGMPTIRTIRPKLINPMPAPTLPRRASAPADVPVVVVVDSGINPALGALSEWVVGRDSSVAPVYRNPEHGTFVAGLIVWGSDLNPTLQGVDSNPCAVFDLQVIPNSDPGVGNTDVLTETAFLQSLEAALQQYANQYKVWNLSLGTESVCSLDEFSALAQALDDLQEKYQVSFVISAGNYQTVPLLDYPRAGTQLDEGRITSPADSVLGITVGSISHVDYRSKGPKEHQPSAFSRHGAGPNYIIKPDLVHYGGACAVDASHVTGVRSLGSGGTAEDIGTSFAAPLVSRTLAQVYHQITPTPSPVLARALLTHHARDPRSGQRVPDREENFFGFGLPDTVPYCLECTPHSATLVFNDTLRPGYFLEWDNFPYPPSLMNGGRYFGEIWMTVAFNPAREPKWGSEYCETHIDAHFGVFRDQVSRKTGVITRKFSGLVPPEHKNPGLLYESYQVEKLRKWAPVRTYHGALGDRGVPGLRWRLKVQLLTRHGIEDDEAFKPQEFSLIVTIADPKKRAPVYDEMAQLMRSQLQFQNLTLRAGTRVRAKA